MNREALYLYLLSKHCGLGRVSLRRLLEYGHQPSYLFENAESLPFLTPSVRKKFIEVRDDADLNKQANDLLLGALDKGIEVITCYDDQYPSLLRECVDAPPLFFYKGNVSVLNAKHAISIVGTRSASPYGRSVTHKLVAELASLFPDLLVVSGLALGIDTAAHTAALDNDLPTMGIMAHGHNFIYPRENAHLFDAIPIKGGLFSESDPTCAIERHRFVERNRIIAGITPCTVVIESGYKGGALITADMALGYNRTIMAVPGRLSDRLSQGCNKLIADGVAKAFTCTKDLVSLLGWQQAPQPNLPLPLGELRELPDDPILIAIAAADQIHFNELLLKTDMSSSNLLSRLVDLELDGYIQALPGGKYALSLS